jgi:ABC-2 type transport system permease protein
MTREDAIRMFRTLLKRQFIEDILTYRFLMSLILVPAAIVVFSFVFAGHYRNLQSFFSKTTARNERNLSQFAKSPSQNLGAADQSLLLRPRPGLFISEAYEETLPQGFRFNAAVHSMWLMNPNVETSGAQVYGSISKKERLSDVLTYSPDLTFIVEFILSFFALILAYEAVTVEKERGTLKLIYSNPAKRAYFVVVKYLSALFTIGMALVMGLLLSLVLLNVLATVPFFSAIVVSFLLFFVVSMIYLSTFILMGISCSVSTYRSKNSLVLCLLIWVFLVIIFPKSTGIFLTQKRFDVPTEEEINLTAQNARFETLDRLEKQLPPEYRANWEKYHLSEQVLKMNYEADKSQQDILDFYLRKKLAAGKEFRRINFLSPASLFEYSASSVSGTGLHHFENLWTQAQRYEEDFTTFVKDENSVLDKGAFFYLDNDTISDKSIDFNAIPKFEDKLPPPGERIKGALPYLGVLVLYNLFLFAFVFYKFQTYDVR